jgi:hypothetical protein
VKSTSIKCGIVGISDEISVIGVVVHCDSVEDRFRKHVWLSSSSEVDGPKSVAACDFTREEEIVFAMVGSTATQMTIHGAHGIDGGLSGFIVSVAVDIKHGNHHAIEVLDLAQDGRVPFAKTILN